MKVKLDLPALRYFRDLVETMLGAFAGDAFFDTGLALLGEHYKTYLLSVFQLIRVQLLNPLDINIPETVILRVAYDIAVCCLAPEVHGRFSAFRGNNNAS